MSHILHAYKIWVHPLGDTAESSWRPLGNLEANPADGGTALSLETELRAFYDEWTGVDWIDGDIHAVARIVSIDDADPLRPGVVVARVMAGETGKFQEYRDVDGDEVGDDVEYTRTREKAATVDLLVVARLRPTWTSGYLVLHAPDGIGVKTRFWGLFFEWFRNRHPDLNVKLESSVPLVAFQELLQQGELQEVRYIRSVKPTDFADAVGQPFEDVDLGTEERKIKVKRGTWHRATLVGAMNNKDVLRGVLTFDGQEYDRVEVGLRHDNKKWAIDLGQTRRPRGGANIDDEIVFDAVGRVDLDDVLVACLGYIDLLEAGGGALEQVEVVPGEG